MDEMPGDAGPANPEIPNTGTDWKGDNPEDGRI